MRMRRQLLAASAWTLVLAALVYGCDGSGEPDGEAESDTTPSSESHAGPSLPKAAEADSQAGAEAYVRYYVDLINYSADTGDTAALRDVVVECGFCQQFPAIYEDLYDNGGSYEGKPYELSGLQVEEGDDGVLATATLDTLPTPFTLKQGDEKKKADPETYTWKISMHPADDGWMITGVDEAS